MTPGKYEHGARLLGGAAPLWHAAGTLLWGSPGLVEAHHRTEAGPMSALGAERFTREHTYGQALPVDELVNAALGLGFTSRGQVTTMFDGLRDLKDLKEGNWAPDAGS
ncbi:MULTISPECIES: hypothetical protein [unclassified Streptomyces]|uniref:hypothetical protein n=1 Tax=unclassified Streptomyces TaxID=2593676 RepID=UPI00278BC1A5|nr:MULTISPECIES: hypothetical protein [unclassified Streptomyces]